MHELNTMEHANTIVLMETWAATGKGCVIDMHDLQRSAARLVDQIDGHGPFEVILFISPYRHLCRPCCELPNVRFIVSTQIRDAVFRNAEQLLNRRKHGELSFDTLVIVTADVAAYGEVVDLAMNSHIGLAITSL